MQIEHGEKLFEFSTFDDWCDTAQRKFQRAEVRSNQVVAVDQKGRLCGWGEHFMTARAENAFPVEVFRLRADMTPNDQAKRPDDGGTPADGRA